MIECINTKVWHGVQESLSSLTAMKLNLCQKCTESLIVKSSARALIKITLLVELLERNEGVRVSPLDNFSQITTINKRFVIPIGNKSLLQVHIWAHSYNRGEASLIYVGPPRLASSISFYGWQTCQTQFHSKFEQIVTCHFITSRDLCRFGGVTSEYQHFGTKVLSPFITYCGNPTLGSRFKKVGVQSCPLIEPSLRIKIDTEVEYWFLKLGGAIYWMRSIEISHESDVTLTSLRFFIHRTQPNM